MKGSLLAGQKILVCGAAGISGRAAARLYLSLGASVLLSDQNREISLEELKRFGEQVKDLRPRQDASLLEEESPDLLVATPGLSLNSAIFEAANRRGLPIRGENDLAAEIIGQLWKRRPYIFAITGTDGKSTTTALLTHLLQEAVGVKALAGANFGRPLSDIALGEEAPALVLECSSFQLELVQYFQPQTALLLNIAQDHTDRYSSQEEYLAAKLNIARCQTQEDLLLIPSELQEAIGTGIKTGIKTGIAAGSKAMPANPAAFPIGQRGAPRIRALSPPPRDLRQNWLCYRGERLLPADQLAVGGYHNIRNARFALEALADFEERLQAGHYPFARDLMKGGREAEGAACGPPWIERSLLKQALRSFRGLEHRLEHVASLKVDGFRRIDFYNDSKATTVQAVQAALESFPCQPIFLLCGGRAKGGGFSNLAGHYQSIFPYGEAASEIGQAVGERDIFAGLEEAFEAALLAVYSYFRQSDDGHADDGDPQGSGAQCSDAQCSDAQSGEAQGSDAQSDDTQGSNVQGEDRPRSVAATAIFLLSPGCSSFDAYADYIERGSHFRQLVRKAVS